MPFLSRAYLRSVGGTANLPLGYHPTAGDTFYVTENDRYAGTYIIGTQGNGKSGLIENMALHDIGMGNAVVVIDPHGDLVDNIVAQLPDTAVANTYVLDMLDEDFPFGVNVFGGAQPRTSVEAAGKIARVAGVFDVLWADVLSQAYLPRYLRSALIVLLANPGSTLVDMKDFLLKDDVRARLLDNLQGYDDVREFWETEYAALTKGERDARVAPLIGRLELLFLGRPLMKNIMGQRETTIDFRRATDERSVVLIKLPIKQLGEDARLIGTILISQLHAAIFSYANTPESQRPGVSLYVDEFQNFSTPQFSELFSEGRKYKARVVIAHQYRNQIPAFLRDSTQTARTKICFNITPDDAPEMGRFFPNNSVRVQPEDISTTPAEYLMQHTPDQEDAFDVYVFTEAYLLPLQNFRRGHRVEIVNRGTDVFGGLIQASAIINGSSGRIEIKVDDPLPYLDRLLHAVMAKGDPNLPIAPEIPRGFANSGRGFFGSVRGIWNSPMLQPNGIQYPPHLVDQTGPQPVWLRAPESSQEQFLHFMFTLRQTMRYLAEHPIGKVTESSASDVAKMLTQLPKRAAFVRSADDVGVIYTNNTAAKADPMTIQTRVQQIQDHTRSMLCHPRAEVEAALRQHIQLVTVAATVSPIPNEVDDEHENDPQATRPAADRWESIS